MTPAKSFSTDSADLTAIRRQALQAQYNRMQHFTPIAMLVFAAILWPLVGDFDHRSAIEIGLRVGLWAVFILGLIALNYHRNVSVRSASRLTSLLGIGTPMVFSIFAIPIMLTSNVGGPDIGMWLLAMSLLVIIPAPLCLFIWRAHKLDNEIDSLAPTPPPLMPPDDLEHFDLNKWDERPKP